MSISKPSLALDDVMRHGFQWIVLSRLQCVKARDYDLEKGRMWETLRLINERPTQLYFAFLLEEVQRDSQTGTIYFSDLVDTRPTGQKNRPDKFCYIVFDNPDYKRPHSPLDGFTL